MPFKDPIVRKQKAAERWEAWAERNPEATKARAVKYRENNPTLFMWHAAKRRAKRDNIEFTITKEDIPSIPEICPIANIPIYGSKRKGPGDNSPTLDRVDCTKGYTKDNICVISFKANRWKSNMTFEDLDRLLKYTHEWRLRNSQGSVPPTPEHC